MRGEQINFVWKKKKKRKEREDSNKNSFSILLSIHSISCLSFLEQQKSQISQFWYQYDKIVSRLAFYNSLTDMLHGDEFI